jgi:hypothetical protein
VVDAAILARRVAWLAIGSLVMRHVSESAARRPEDDLPDLLWEADHALGRATIVIPTRLAGHVARVAAPQTSFWRDAQFDTIRLCLIKVAGRVTEMITRIKLALPTAYRHARRPYRQAAAVNRGAAGPRTKPRRNLKP